MLHDFDKFIQSVHLAIYSSDMDHSEFWTTINVFIYNRLHPNLQELAHEIRPENLINPLLVSPTTYLKQLEVIFTPYDNAQNKLLAYIQLK